MKKYLFIPVACLLAAFGLAACDDDEMPQVTPTATGTMTDLEGNEYPWVRIGGLDWMAADLKCGEPFDESEEALACIKEYGNFYYIDEALANCPEGWRLPTDEDWQSLERALGMPEGDIAGLGWRGNCAPAFRCPPTVTCAPPSASAGRIGTTTENTAVIGHPQKTLTPGNTIISARYAP